VKARKTGFTLIELLVVIAIIALLMGMLMPVLARARETARRVVCAGQVRAVGIAITAYASDYGGRMPTYNSSASATSPYYLVHSYALYRSDYLGAGGKPLPMKLALLYEGKYISDPQTFYCPSNKERLYKYEYYCNPMPWGSLPQNENTTGGNNQWVRMGYSYLPTDTKSAKDSTGTPIESAKTLDSVNSGIPYMADLVRHLDQMSHSRQGHSAVNALFKDGRVSLCNSARVFDDSVWQEMEGGTVAELVGNYRIFKLIGGEALAAN
jgi:prepilin-type N-terminal cleavage/methylation domain-containing protein